jgi:hypothetical protein
MQVKNLALLARRSNQLNYEQDVVRYPNGETSVHRQAQQRCFLAASIHVDVARIVVLAFAFVAACLVTLPSPTTRTVGLHVGVSEHPLGNFLEMGEPAVTFCGMDRTNFGGFGRDDLNYARRTNVELKSPRAILTEFAAIFPGHRSR